MNLNKAAICFRALEKGKTIIFCSNQYEKGKTISLTKHDNFFYYRLGDEYSSYESDFEDMVDLMCAISDSDIANLIDNEQKEVIIELEESLFDYFV